MHGFGFWWRESYVASLTTRESRGSQQDVQLSVLGSDSHVHMWVADPSELSSSGLRAKSRSTHISSATSLPASGPFVRLEARWDPALGKPVVNLDTPIADGQMTGEVRTSSSRMIEKIDLGAPQSDRIVVEFFLVARSSSGGWANGRVLEWGPGASWQLGVRVSAVVT